MERKRMSFQDELQKAKNGERESQFYAAQAYYFGDETDRNLDEAFRWFHAAAEGGDVWAQFILGDLYARGEGTEANETLAEEWYLKASNQELLPFFFQFRFTVMKCSPSERVNCKDKAWGAFMGRTFYDKIDDQRTKAWLAIAAENGSAYAQNELAESYLTGERSFKEDETLSMKWRLQAAENGSAEAQCFLGVCAFTGEGLPQDNAQAARWFRKAAEQDYKQAQFWLGQCYFNGRGVTQNFKESARWFRLSAECFHHDAVQILEELGEIKDN